MPPMIEMLRQGGVMEKSTASRRCGIAAALMFGGGLVQPAAMAAEEATIKAFSAWQGQGRTFQTGPQEATFVGAFAGTVYVETEKGPIRSGQMVCPAIVTIDLDDGSQQGTGRCSVTAEDGAQLFAELSCSGFHLLGCDGEFKLTGGSGRFEGITGGGPVTIRSELREISVSSESGASEQGRGIIYWSALHYTLP